MLKNLILVVLVLAITIPTNAAVSVSDGSAFITKNEFSYEMNTLSNRMSYLENSMNAKIDSLVSSYLSRNGIWNGEKQEFLYYKTTNPYYGALNNPTSDTPYFTEANAPLFTNINNGSRGKTTIDVACQNMYELYDLFTATKSGLCFFRISLVNCPERDKNTYYRMYSNNGKYGYGWTEKITTSAGEETVQSAWQNGRLTAALWNNLEKSTEAVRFVAYFFDKKKEYDEDKGIDYWGINEDPVQGKAYLATRNTSGSFEYIPEYAESTLAFTMLQTQFTFIQDSFFVNKGTTYSFGLRLFRGAVPYPYNCTASTYRQLTGIRLGPVSTHTSFVTNYFTIY